MRKVKPYRAMLNVTGWGCYRHLRCNRLFEGVTVGYRAKWEYFRAIYERYHKANRKLKHAILNEFCLNAGYHRKYAIRLLNGAPPGKRPDRRVRRRGVSYGHQVLSILMGVWEAAGYPWSVPLKALLPLWMPWIRKRFKISRAIERQLLIWPPLILSFGPTSW
jgi:hypothetical protein